MAKYKKKGNQIATTEKKCTAYKDKLAESRENKQTVDAKRATILPGFKDTSFWR